MYAPWDFAHHNHPTWRVCAAEEMTCRGPRPACGYPLDPALGPVAVHPWCVAYDPGRPGLLARRELAAVRLADIRRTRLAALEQRITE